MSDLENKNEQGGLSLDDSQLEDVNGGSNALYGYYFVTCNWCHYDVKCYTNNIMSDHKKLYCPARADHQGEDVYDQD